MTSPIRTIWPLLLMLVACNGQDATDSTLAPKGILAITVTGLPGDVAAIVVSGPAGYSRVVKTSTTLTALEDGTYTIAASSVVVSASTYVPTVATLTVEVAAADSTAAVAVSYVVADGSLDLVISGLPGGTPGSVAIAGPAGFSRTATTSEIFPNLVPGRYSLSASNVSASGATYEPTPPVTVADVAASSLQTVLVIKYASASPVARVTISPAQKTFALIPGMVTPAIRLVAYVVDSAGWLRAGRVVTWASDDITVATVDSTGRVEAVGPGAAGITATSGGISAKSAISVVSLSGPPPIAGTWTLSVSGSLSGGPCHGSGTITMGQPAISGYSPATAALGGGCSSDGRIRSRTYSFAGTTAFQVALDGTSFGFTIGSCSFSGQITDIFGSLPSTMNGSGFCGGWPRILFSWSASRR